MCRPYGWFLGRNFLNMGPFSGRFSIKKGGLSRKGENSQKMGRFPPKFITKVDMTACFGNKMVPF